MAYALFSWIYLVIDATAKPRKGAVKWVIGVLSSVSVVELFDEEIWSFCSHICLSWGCYEADGSKG